VHPCARDLGDAAKAIVESRLSEESDAKQTLASPPRSRSTPNASRAARRTRGEGRAIRDWHDKHRDWGRSAHRV